MILWWSIVHLHVYIASNSHLLVQIMLTFFDDTFVVHCSFAHNFHFNSHLFYWSHAGVYYTLVGHCSFAHSFHSNSHLFYWSHAGVYYTLVVHCSFAHSFQQLLAFLKSVHDSTLEAHCSFAHSLQQALATNEIMQAFNDSTLEVHCSFAHSFQQALALLKFCRYTLEVHWWFALYSFLHPFALLWSCWNFFSDTVEVHCSFAHVWLLTATLCKSWWYSFKTIL